MPPTGRRCAPRPTRTPAAPALRGSPGTCYPPTRTPGHQRGGRSRHSRPSRPSGAQGVGGPTVQLRPLPKPCPLSPPFFRTSPFFSALTHSVSLLPRKLGTTFFNFPLTTMPQHLPKFRREIGWQGIEQAPHGAVPPGAGRAGRAVGSRRPPRLATPRAPPLAGRGCNQSNEHCRGDKVPRRSPRLGQAPTRLASARGYQRRPGDRFQPQVGTSRAGLGPRLGTSRYAN